MRNFKRDKLSIGHYILIILIFSMPFPQSFFLWVFPFFLIYSLILLIVDKHKVKDIKSIISKSYGLILFFTLYLIEFLFLNNKTVTYPVFERILLFVVLPLSIVPFYDYYRSFSSKRNELFKSFILSLFIIGLFLFIRALFLSIKIENSKIIFYQYNRENWNSYFSYIGLSFYMHPTYLSLFYFTGLLFIYFLDLGFNKWFKIFCFVFFIFIIFQLSSRSVIICLIVSFYIEILLWVRKKSLMLRIFFLVTIFFLPAALYFQNNRIRGHYSYNEKSDYNVKSLISTDSIRLEIWKSSLKLIKEKPFLGYGLNNFENVLIKEYNENDLEIAVQKRFNAHNQYFETMLMFGSVGLLLLIFIIIAPLKYLSSLFHKKIIFYFLGLFVINFLTESIFKMHKGILLFTFFYIFLYIIPIPTKNKVSLE